MNYHCVHFEGFLRDFSNIINILLVDIIFAHPFSLGYVTRTVIIALWRKVTCTIRPGTSVLISLIYHDFSVKVCKLPLTHFMGYCIPQCKVSFAIRFQCDKWIQRYWTLVKVYSTLVSHDKNSQNMLTNECCCFFKLSRTSWQTQPIGEVKYETLADSAGSALRRWRRQRTWSPQISAVMSKKCSWAGTLILHNGVYLHFW